MTDKKIIEVTEYEAHFGTKKKPFTESLTVKGKLDNEPIIIEIERDEDKVVKSLYESGISGCPKVVAETIERYDGTAQHQEIDEIGTLKPVDKFSSGREWFEGYLNQNHVFQTTQKSDPTDTLKMLLPHIEEIGAVTH
jgi:hypothetical protein